MTLYYICMWRFGECYEIITDDVKVGTAALKKKYIKLYRAYNDESPTSEEVEEMINDLEITEMQLNKVKEL